MKFNPKYKPELCCAKGDALNRVQLDADAKKLIGLSGPVIVTVPCDPEGASTGAIPTAALKDARRDAKRHADAGMLLTDEYAGLHSRKVDPEDVCFPKHWRETIPTSRLATVILDARQIKAIADAMGSDLIALSFGAPDEPVLVYSTEYATQWPPSYRALRDHDRDPVAVFMPHRLAKEE